MMRSARSGGSSDAVDRILIGMCTVIWLGVLGVGVAATVVLVDMGSGRHSAGAGSKTPWLLYAVIGVSALVIVGAIPLLLRARRAALAESGRGPATPSRATRATARPSGTVPARMPGEAQTEKLRVFGSIADPGRRNQLTHRGPQATSRRTVGGVSQRTVERLWFRATVIIAAAMGAATLGVTTATYLMGVDKASAAWIVYCVAAVVTVAIPVIPWLYLRQLRATIVTRVA